VTASPTPIADVLEKAAELEALAVRCEAASGPDVCLAKDIFRAVHPDKVPHSVVLEGYGWHEDSAGWWLQTGEDQREPRKTIYPPNWLGSLDVAVTLVPKGCEWRVSDPANADGSKSIFGYPSRCHAYVAGGDREHNYGATPAIALACAALRSAASLAREKGNG